MTTEKNLVCKNFSMKKASNFLKNLQGKEASDFNNIAATKKLNNQLNSNIKLFQNVNFPYISNYNNDFPSNHHNIKDDNQNIFRMDVPKDIQLDVSNEYKMDNFDEDFYEQFKKELENDLHAKKVQKHPNGNKKIHKLKPDKDRPPFKSSKDIHTYRTKNFDIGQQKKKKEINSSNVIIEENELKNKHKLISNNKIMPFPDYKGHMNNFNIVVNYDIPRPEVKVDKIKEHKEKEHNNNNKDCKEKNEVKQLKSKKTIKNFNNNHLIIIKEESSHPKIENNKNQMKKYKSSLDVRNKNEKDNIGENEQIKTGEENQKVINPERKSFLGCLPFCFK